MFLIIVDIIIVTKSLLGLPLTPVLSYQVLAKVKSSTDALGILTNIRRRGAPLKVPFKPRSYEKKSNSVPEVIFHICKLFFYVPAYRYLFIFLCTNYLFDNKNSYEFMTQHLVPTLLAPSQYEDAPHLRYTNHKFIKDEPDAYEDALIEDEWYERDYIKTMYDEHMVVHDISRPIRTRRMFKTWLRRLRDYRITYLGYWYRKRKMRIIRRTLVRFPTLPWLRRKVYHGLLYRSTRDWIYRKTRLPIKMLSQSLAFWRDRERTTFFTYRIGEGCTITCELTYVMDVDLPCFTCKITTLECSIPMSGILPLPCTGKHIVRYHYED